MSAMHPARYFPRVVSRSSNRFAVRLRTVMMGRDILEVPDLTQLAAKLRAKPFTDCMQGSAPAELAARSRFQLPAAQRLEEPDIPVITHCVDKMMCNETNDSTDRIMHDAKMQPHNRRRHYAG